MTERDKKLLALLFALLAAIAAFRWLITPVVQERLALQEQLEEATREQKERSGRLQRMEALDEDILRREEELEKLSEPYGEYLPTEEMDRMVTELFLRHNLIPRSLVVTEGVTGVLRDYLVLETSREEQAKYGAPYDGISLKELLKQSCDEEAVRSIEEKGGAYLYIASVRMEADGTEEAFLSLLDDLEAHHLQLRMREFALEGKEIHCELELYFCGK